MEEIKTNLDKIMDQFTEATSHSKPKRLSFEYMNDSFESSFPKKRKLSVEKIGQASEIKSEIIYDTRDKNVSRESLNSSVTSSPWEARRLKADLLEAKSRITQLRQEIEQQHMIRSKMEIMYNNKVSSLQQQCDFSSGKVIDTERHVTILRKRENTAKAELVKTQNQLNKQKQSSEETISNLLRTNKDLEENMRALQNKLANEASDFKRKIDKLECELSLTSGELEKLREIQADFKEKASMYDKLKLELETEKHQHSMSKTKIKELEHDMASYGDWKEISKTSQNRLSNMPDLEKENVRLRQEIKTWKDLLGNKLLLEEQVSDLKSRLEKYEQCSTDSVTLQVQINALEKELKDWKQLATDHSIPSHPINANSLRTRIEQLLQKDLISTCEKGNTKSKKDEMQSQLRELQSQNEIYTKANNDLKATLNHNKNILLRIQKKLMFVLKERDCYKQLVENFEKDLTITGALADTLNPDSQLRARLEMVEKTLGGYKEMCANLEKELASTKLLPEIPLEMSINTDSYDRLKKEIETLRIENERLRRRKEELELEMEHRCLKGDFNVDKCKVVHMVMNPASEAYENSKNEMEKLQAEIERLKRRNRKLEEDNEEMTSKLNETTNLTVNVKEVNSLRAMLEAAESKFSHMKDVLKTSNLEYRDVVYMLFGYRVDRFGTGNYRISSMYAESEEEYLNFRLNESGVLDMLETDYSISLNDMIRTHLGQQNSLATFFSALTLELFNRTTMNL